MTENKLVSSSFINGEWLTEGRNSEDIINPYNGEVIGVQYQANEDDVELALQKSFEAKKQIKMIPAYERAEILIRASKLLNDAKERFAKILSMELGKPLKNTLGEVNRSVETLQLSGEEAKRLHGETLPGDASERGVNSIAYTHRVPIGVVGAITPFNAPLNLGCHKIGPSFAGGNVTVLKPAPQTTLIATELLKLLFEAGFPKEAFNMVLGGVEAGQKIVQDKRVSVISFTGGLVAAENISKTAGVKKTLFELGGNAATIVHKDADVNYAAKLSAKTGYSNSGQSCISVQRIYVHENVLVPFVEKLKTEVEQLTVGDPLDPASDVGTMVDEANANRVMDWIFEAVEQGAEVLCGGERNGASVKPTVVLNPPKDSKLVCQEVFGPVVTVIPYNDLDEAIQEADDSDFGLQVGLFTNDIQLIHQVADEMEVGGVVINGTSNYRLDHWPYGGVKNSGIGREGPRYAVEELTESKMVVIRFNQ